MEELGHLEMVGSIVSQLVKDLPCDDIDLAGFEKYYVDHTLGVWPQSAGGVPFSATTFQSCGDPNCRPYRRYGCGTKKPEKHTIIS